MGMVINCFVVLLCVVSVKPNISKNDDLEVLLASSKSKIRGHILQSAQGKNFYAFQQVPYAAPPVGHLRFKPPQKPEKWNGILDATKNKKICPQVISTTLLQDEDCLFLNVYTPVRPKSKIKLAVYVWIHGGGYAVWDGTIDRYGPQYLIDYNIVVVTLQYRLGVFGFLSTEDGVIPGNLGLRDQNLALRWVQENIHLFGGDPKKVTIGGESAGATSVSMHILSPLSKGLFRGAIQESGSSVCTFNYQPKADYYAFEFGRLLDGSLKNGESQKLLKLLQEANVTDLVEAQKKVVNTEQWISVIPDVIWAPTVERSVKTDKAFLSEPMDALFRNGNINRVPMLLGFSQEEMIWFLPSSIMYSIPVFLIQWDQLDQLISYLDEDSGRLVNDKLNILDSDKTKVGNLIKKLYTNTTFANDREAYLKFAGDIFFSLGTTRQAQLASRYVPDVFLYQFSYTPYNKTTIQAAEHTEELQYFWHNIESPAFINSFQAVLRHRMLKMWTNFIKYQNPTPDIDEDLDSTIWPPVDPTVIPYLNISDTFQIGSNPKNYFQYDQIVNKFKNPPFYVY